MATKNIINGRSLRKNDGGNIMRGAGAQGGDEGKRGAEMMGGERAVCEDYVKACNMVNNEVGQVF